MKRSKLFLGAVALVLGASAQATTLTFTGDPFAGSTAPATPGRQVVGGEPSIAFSPGVDELSFEGGFFAFVGTLGFANGTIDNIPVTGVNVAVLRTFDDDSNAATPFGAGNAANLLAAQTNTPGAGLFVYFNSALDVARLVYSADLNDASADLKILARMTNLTGAAGRDAMSQIRAENFAFAAAAPVPEPENVLLLGSGMALMAFWRRRMNRKEA